MDKEIIKEYSNEEITILWKPKKCIHSAVCVGGLPDVFRPKQKPWINMVGANSDQIKTQVKQCPSGALSLKGDDKQIKNNLSDRVTIADTKPMVLQVDEGKTYAWCACGLSGNQPWCDGSHKTTSITPKIFKVHGYSKAAMCMCKHSDNKPFCDGTHSNL